MTKSKKTRADSGFSLIELMVALVIGSILIVGAVSVYIQSRSSFATNEAAARLHAQGRYAEGMSLFLGADGDEAAMARKVIAGYISYAFHRVGEVTDTINGIDRIMATGFNWAPPSVLVDVMGPKAAVDLIDRLGLPEAVRLPGSVRDLTKSSRLTLQEVFVLFVAVGVQVEHGGAERPAVVTAADRARDPGW